MLVVWTNGKQLGGRYQWWWWKLKKVVSWAHMEEGATKRLFQAGTALPEECCLQGLPRQGQEEFGFSTEGPGSHTGYGAGRGMHGPRAGRKGFGQGWGSVHPVGLFRLHSHQHKQSEAKPASQAVRTGPWTGVHPERSLAVTAVRSRGGAVSRAGRDGAASGRGQRPAARLSREAFAGRPAARLCRGGA